jgi:hypothetical protein
MANVIVRNIPERDYAKPPREAQQAQGRRRMARAIRKLDRLRDEVSKKYPVDYEMWDLTREDREGRRRT